ncbi:helix-turn-helix domain-containing protein [Actinomadura soli]|uniref:Helix-turn-helix domain-containing protein n=1 Tax=Actinomadura soli TaxID=2508997 RepID=A0A5C4JBI6_9ACTN|nr:helix-turn-helix domain-containing protein [Actinomadura soli]
MLLKPERAAVLLSIGRTKVYELMRSGALPSVRFGGSRRIPATALRQFVAQLEEDGEAA